MKAPDFKHKETGEALWMTDSPIWVLSKLPPLKKNQERPLMSNTVSQLELDVVEPKGNLKQLKSNFFFKQVLGRYVAFVNMSRLSKTRRCVM